MDTLIVLAGGQGQRLSPTANKVLLEVDGKALLSYPIEAAANFADKVRLVLVIRAEDRSAIARLVPDSFQPLMVVGGASRYESERAGIEAIAPLCRRGDVVGIHDGARPFLTVDLWEVARREARDRGGAVPVLAAGPLHRLDEASLIPLGTDLFKAQTPQVFGAEGLIEAFRRSSGPAADTAETVHRHGKLQIAAVAGDARNLKVTFPADLAKASELARRWRAGRWLAAV